MEAKCKRFSLLNCFTPLGLNMIEIKLHVHMIKLGLALKEHIRKAGNYCLELKLINGAE